MDVPRNTGTSATVVHVGTRRSALALKQTELVVNALSAAFPALKFEVHGQSVLGDADKTTPLPALSQTVGGKGLWTSELEAMLAAGEIDMVVHSLKDMPTTLPEGCVLAGVTEREDPRDVLVVRQRASSSDSQSEAGGPSAEIKCLADLPRGSTIGTSSLRRVAQLRRRYGASHNFNYVDLRGNIDTRVAKCDDASGPYDAIVLAAAGLLRMGRAGRIVQYLDSSPGGGGMLHAVGQGAIGIECRSDDVATLTLVSKIEHMPTRLAVLAERAVMRALEGGCSVPIGVETSWVDDEESEGDGEGADEPSKVLRLTATVVSVDGSEGADAVLSARVESDEDAEQLGRRVAAALVEAGAARILEAINASRAGGAQWKKT